MVRSTRVVALALRAVLCSGCGFFLSSAVREESSNPGSPRWWCVAAALNGRPYGPGDCTSTQTNPADDVDGFNWGHVTLSDVGL